MRNDARLVRRAPPKRLWEDKPEVGGWNIWCPACQCGHFLDELRWIFNGNYDAPSFTPSLKTTFSRGEPPVTPENLADYQRAPWTQTTVTEVCHSVITDGKINYCGDCTHALRGQTVPMEPF